MTATRHPDWLAPGWRLPGVGALMTTRRGGVSVAPFDSLNLRAGIGDDDGAVRHNQRVVADAADATPVWLRQVHGVRVVTLGARDTAPDAPIHEADASVTTVPGIACAAQVADCLPVLFAAVNPIDGRQAVGAAHAGWRGLAGGVLEATLQALCDASGCVPSQVHAWLGACIGPARFEVGPDVLAAFVASACEGASTRFLPHAPGKWLADLPGLARDRLAAAGVTAIAGGRWCTVSDASRFFSFRREPVTGRMAALVWIEAGTDPDRPVVR